MSLRSLAILPLSAPDAITAPPVSAPITVEFKAAVPQGWTIRRGKLRHVPVEEGGGLVPVETTLNAWDVRGDFLTASTEQNILELLERTGTFSHLNESGYWSVEDLFTIQRVVRYLMATHPSKWRLTTRVFREVFGNDQRILNVVLRQADQRVRFIWTTDAHAAAILADTTLQAILATVHVDHLRGATFRFCARLDCGKQFPIESRHAKKYCSYDCSHLQAVRRSRGKA